MERERERKKKWTDMVRTTNATVKKNVTWSVVGSFPFSLRHMSPRKMSERLNSFIPWVTERDGRRWGGRTDGAGV